MKNKKAIIIMATLGVGILIFNLISFKNAKINETTEQVNNTNMLTMMLETEAGTGNYEEVTQSEWPQNGYVFNENLSKCENGGTLSWDDSTKKVIMKSNISDKCYVYFDVYVEPTIGQKICNSSGANSLSCYLANSIYTEDGVNGLYYHDGTGTYTNASQEAGDNSYRYSGAGPNNYVCFGSDVTTCSNDNLYRIIGLFDEDGDGTYNIKLIKSSPASSSLLGENGAYRSENSYYWNNSTNTNNWSESNLNTINLNTNYWTNLGSRWQNLIEISTWKVGGNTANNLYNTSVKNTFQNEIVSPAVGTTYSDEIGLVYLSDYGYATSPEHWTTRLSDYDNDNITTNNWMYTGDSSEWTITRRSDTTDFGIYIFMNGDLTYLNVDGFYGGPTVRPVFYLKSNVNLTSGDGSRSNPFRVSA